MGYPKWRWEYDDAIIELKGLSEAAVLDIGAGEGNFLNGLPNHFEKSAIESSDTTIAKLEGKGINAYKSIEENLPEWKAKFDCVSMFQVLEHISEFDAILDSIQKILKSKGKLILSVPNADDMFEQERILDHPDMPPNHINKWSVESLKIALSKHNLRLISYKYERRSLKNIISKVHLKLLANANRPNRIESKIYSIQKKSLRLSLLVLIFPFVFLELLPHLNFLTKGGAIYVVAEKENHS